MAKENSDFSLHAKMLQIAVPKVYLLARRIKRAAVLAEMISMSFEYEIKEFAKSLGADLVGIAPSDSEYQKDNNASIEAILPGCRSLVVIAKRLNSDAISSKNIKIPSTILSALTKSLISYYIKSLGILKKMVTERYLYPPICQLISARRNGGCMEK